MKKKDLFQDPRCNNGQQIMFMKAKSHVNYRAFARIQLNLLPFGFIISRGR